MNKVALHSSSDSMGGVKRFPDTRVPVSRLFDYLAEGENLDRFCDGYPRVRREDCVAVLKDAQRLIERRKDRTGKQTAPPTSREGGRGSSATPR